MTPRKELLKLGRRGQHVRVFVEKGYARVQWTEGGRRRTESWADGKAGRAEAKAYAEATHERLVSRRPAELPPVTLRALFEAFAAAHDHVRPATWTNYTNRWAKFELYAGRDTRATDVTRETLDGFRRALLATPAKGRARSPGQVMDHLQCVRMVFRFGVDRDLIPATKVVGYRPKRSRDAKPLAMAEFRREDADKVLAQWNPRSARDWRPWAFTTLLTYCGPRQTAARSLEWRDVDFAARTVTWRGELDKVGRERTQPLPHPVVDALWVCYGWRCAEGYAGPFVFYRPGAGLVERGNGGYATARARARAAAKPDKPMTYSGYNHRLHAAERQAGITPKLYRAAHGFRRGVVGDVLEATGGNYKLAGDFVGDVDLRVIRRHYDKERSEQMRGVADLLGAPVKREDEV